MTYPTAFYVGEYDDAADFIREIAIDEPGDVGAQVEPERKEENAGPDGINETPKEQLTGEPGPASPDARRAEQTATATGLAAFLRALFTPQPTTQQVNESQFTPEFPTDSATAAQLEQLRAALRYIGTQAQKVTETPARHILFPSVTVTETPIQIAGYQPNRKRLVIRNTNDAGGDSIYLGNSQSVDTNGFEIPAGAQQEIYACDEIWAVCAATETARVEMIAEHYA